MSVYQSSPDAAPDSDFEPGALHHFVGGNRGRLLDPRRTPISVVEIRPQTGFVVIRIEGFEDAGATWEVPLEDAAHFQFTPGSTRAIAGAVDEMRAAIGRCDRRLVVEVASADRRRSDERIKRLRADADTWLTEHSRFLAGGRRLPDPATRRGDEELGADLETYMRDLGMWEMEATFAGRFVSNPNAGEVVKGHRIALASLGLAPYDGTIVRDPATLADPWTLEQRVDHVLRRLAFLRALFARLGIRAVTLWRGLAADTPLRPRRRRSFVSTSFAEVVARSHFDGGAGRATRALVCQSVPVERLFMTYLETGAMNDRFLEAEAVLLARRDDGWP